MTVRRRVSKAGVLLVAVLAFASTASPVAADGPSGFAVGGWASLIGVQDWRTLKIGVDGSSRILAYFIRNDGDLEVRRFLPDGRADASYGTDAVVVIPFVSDGSSGIAQTVTTDGAFAVRDVVSGHARTRRVTPEGVLDSSYGDGGQLLDAGAVAPNGSIYRTQSTGGTWSVERFDAEGHLDATYGDDGTAEIPGCDAAGGGATAEVEPLGDADALVTCTVAGVDALRRLGSTGTVVGSLVQAGVADFAVTVAGDDQLVLTKNSGGTVQVQRLSAELVRDATFGGSGTATVPGYVLAVTASGDHTYVATGVETSSGIRRTTVRIASVDADGLDPAFGTAGLATVEVGMADPRTRQLDFRIGVAPDDADGLMVISTVLPVGQPDSEFDFDARVRAIDPQGEVTSEVRTPVVVQPAVLPGHGAVVGLSTVDATLATQTNAIRRFVAEPVAPFDSAEAFAQQLSLDVRGRAATSVESDVFTTAIAAGVPASTLVRRALAEPEWASRLDPSVRLYWAYFGRPPDPSGLRYWMTKRATGTTVARMSAVFADSREFKRTYGSLTNRQFVELVYRNVMNREGDAAGVAYWTARLDGRRTSRGHLMATFSESSEHVRRRSAQVSTVSLFMALLDRTPSADELVVWSGPAPMGDAAALARWLLSSEAYAARIG